MRVLIVTSEAPLPPPNGSRLVVDSLWRHLVADHGVQVLALLRSDQDPADLPPGAPVELHDRGPDDRLRTATDLLGALATGRPPTVRALAELLGGPLRRHLAEFEPDVVHVLPGAMVDLRREIRDVPVVLTALDAIHLNLRARARESDPVRRMAVAWKRRRWERCISDRYPRFEAVTVVTAQDRRALLELAPTARIEVVPNGVDTDRFRPRGRPEPDQRIVFHGVLRYPPNVTAARLLAERILPRVRDQLPGTALELVGLDPTPAVCELGELPGVTVTGWVDDVVAALGRADVYVCPMTTGTGIKNKLLEAMACARPCVATPLAVQGLSVTDGVDLLVRGSPEGISDGVVELLRDRHRAAELGSAARRFVVEEHSWGSVIERYVAVYRSVGGGGA